MNTYLKWIIGLVVLILIAVGFSFLAGEQEPAATGPVKIGFVGPLSGDAVSLGEPMRNAVELAAAEVNGRGGIDGRQVEIIYEDGGCNARDSLSAGQKLINVDGVVAIIGGLCSGELLAIAPLLEQHKVVALSPTASSPDITDAGDFVFRNNPSDTSSGESLASLVGREHTKVAVLAESTDFAQAFKDVFTASFGQQNGTVVLDEDFSPDVTDFRSVLARVRESEAEALVVIPQTEVSAGNVVKQAGEIGLSIPILGANTMAGLGDLIGAAANGVTFVDLPALSRDNTRVADFLDSYQTQYGDPRFEFYMGASYDTVYILAQAIENAGSDPEDIRDYLYGLTDFDGLIGTYGFDENGDVFGFEWVARQIQNGEIVDL